VTFEEPSHVVRHYRWLSLVLSSTSRIWAYVYSFLPGLLRVLSFVWVFDLSLLGAYSSTFCVEGYFSFGLGQR
jgi:hypothetical protein